MPDLVPLKVKMRVQFTANGRRNKFPDFNSIAEATRENLDWSVLVDKYNGQQSDQLSDVDDDDSANDSPLGVKLILITVPKAFADAAVLAFPSDITKLTDGEAQTFYETRAHVLDPSVHKDQGILDTIQLKNALSIALDADDTAALDPTSRTGGLTNNLEKRWAQFKSRRSITTVQ